MPASSPPLTPAGYSANWPANSVPVGGSFGQLVIASALQVSGTGILVSNGSASAPSISFINDTSTGIFLSATGDMRFVVGGVEIFRVMRAGGISSLSFFGVSPSQRLTISSLMDNSGGIASDTISAAGTLYSQADENNFRASITRKVNQILILLTSYGLRT